MWEGREGDFARRPRPGHPPPPTSPLSPHATAPISPVGVSIATPMLCAAFTISSVPSSETLEFSVGYSARARDVALTINGMSVNLDNPCAAATALSSCLAAAKASIRTSSQYPKWGTCVSTRTSWIARARFSSFSASLAASSRSYKLQSVTCF